MVRSLRHKALKRLYHKGQGRGLPPEFVRRLRLILADLDAARQPKDLELPGYRLHPLRGDMKGRWAINVSGNLRVIFRFEAEDVYDVDLVDYH